MPTQRDYRPGPQYGPRTLRDVAGAGDDYARILFAGADARARAQLEKGAVWSDAVSGLGDIATDYFHQRDQKKADEAVRLATSPEYPSATQPVPGSASDVPDPGTNHIDAILSRVSPEMRPRAEKAISEFQAQAAKAKEAEKVAAQRKQDAIALGAYHARSFFDSPDGGVSGMNGLLSLAQANGYDTKRYEQFAQGANEGWQQVQNEPPEVQAIFKKAFQEQAGPLYDQLSMGASPELAAKITPKPKEDFTLTPGGVRFGPDGKPIASVPATPKEPPAPPKLSDEEEYIRLAYGEKPTAEQRLQGRRAFAAAGSPPRQRGEITPTAEAALIGNLSKQWTTATKPLAELDRAAKLMDSGMEAARKGDLAQGSQAVLVTFQKILDPTSVVRESEFDRSAEGQALLTRAKGAVERLVKGGAGVPLSELEKFATLARSMAKAQASGRIPAIKERIGKTADRYQIPRDLVFEQFDYGGETPPAGGSGPVMVQTPEEARKLPPGTLFQTPDGRQKRVPGAR